MTSYAALFIFLVLCGLAYGVGFLAVTLLDFWVDRYNERH